MVRSVDERETVCAKNGAGKLEFERAGCEDCAADRRTIGPFKPSCRRSACPRGEADEVGVAVSK